MPDYAYMIVYTLNGSRDGEFHLTKHAFTGTPDEFGRSVMLDFIARNRSLESEFVAVTVWDSDRDGVGEMSSRAALVSTNDLGSGPANQSSR